MQKKNNNCISNVFVVVFYFVILFINIEREVEKWWFYYSTRVLATTQNNNKLQEHHRQVHARRSSYLNMSQMCSYIYTNISYVNKFLIHFSSSSHTRTWILITFWIKLLYFDMYNTVTSFRSKYFFV